jgi:AcrR family transcriptional regulator
MRLPAPRRRTQLLDMARELFAAQGFHATSMDEVAEAAGVTKPVLYQHFPSKRALYRELLEDVGRRLLAEITTATATAHTGHELVVIGFTAYFGFVIDNQSAFRLLFGASVRNDAEFAAVAEEVLESLAEAVTEMIALDVPTEQRRVLAHAVVGMAEAVGRRALFDARAEFDAELLADWTSELAWYGLRGIRTGEDAKAAGTPRRSAGGE